MEAEEHELAGVDQLIEEVLHTSTLEDQIMTFSLKITKFRKLIG